MRGVLTPRFFPHMYSHYEREWRVGKIMVWLARVVVDLSGWPPARPNLRDRARQLRRILKYISDVMLQLACLD